MIAYLAGNTVFADMRAHLAPEIDIPGDPAADVSDKRQAVVQGSLHFVPLLFLLPLAVDCGQVPVDRPGTDDELLGHLRIGQSLGYEAQYLRLSLGQSCRQSGHAYRRRREPTLVHHSYVHCYGRRIAKCLSPAPFEDMAEKAIALLCSNKK